MRRRKLSQEGKRLSVKPDRGILLNEPSFLKDTHANHLLSQVIKEVLDEMKVSCAGIWLLDRDKSFVPRIIFGGKEELYAMTHSRRFIKILKYTAERKKYIVIYNLHKLKDERFKKAARKESLFSLITYPLLINDIPIGVLMVCVRKKELPLTKHRIKTGNLLAKSAALTLKSLYLYKKSQDLTKQKRHREQDKALHLIRKLRTITQPVDDITKSVRNVLKETYKLSSADLIVVKQYNRKRRKFNTITLFPQYKTLSSHHMEIDNLLDKEAAKRGSPLSIEDLNFYCKEILNKDFNLEYKSFLAFPIVDRKYMIGIVNIYWYTPRLLNELEFNAIEATSSILSMFLRNQDLINKVKAGTLNVIRTLAALTETKDRYTHGHSKKVMEYSMIICKRLKLSGKDTNIIREAALLHDLGKVVIDNKILHKKTALSRKEWQEIKKHPVTGADIIAKTGFLTELVAIVEHHHERFAGGGYPNPKMKRYHIPLGSRIIAVADAYDAMNSKRAYRRAISRREIIRELYNVSGAQFDPQIVRVFAKEVTQIN